MMRIRIVSLYVLLFILIVPVLFINLGKQPLYVWDEARLAVNAIEMLYDNDYIVTHFEGLPDMYNTKPPLLIWIQAFSLKLLGENEFAVRLPSALAALFTCVIMAVFFAKRGYHFIASLSCLILITQESFLDYHAARAADYEALLTLLTTAYILLFFTYLESKSSKYIFLTCLVIALSALCKGVSGLLFVPSLFAYAIGSKNVFVLLKDRNFYFGLVSFFILVGGYYLLREYYNPGYLKIVWENELGGRYGKVIDGHGGGWNFYLKNLYDYRFSYHWYYFLFGIPLGIIIKDKFINRLTIYLTICIVFYLIVISLGATKLIWYDVPLLPLLAIISSICLYAIYKFIVEKISRQFNNKYSIVAAVAMVFGVLIHTYSFSLRASINSPSLMVGDDPAAMETSKFLKEVISDNNRLITKDTLYLCYSQYYSPFNFYEKALTHEAINLIRINNIESISFPANVIIPQNEQQLAISQNYNYRIAHELDKVKFFEIISKK